MAISLVVVIEDQVGPKQLPLAGPIDESEEKPHAA